MTHNSITIIGYLGNDAEVFSSRSGDTDLTTWSVATTDRERGEDVTTWHRCVIFDAPDPVRLAKKGDLVAVVGRLRVDKYEKDGQQFQRPEIIANRAIILTRKEDKVDRPRQNDHNATPARSAGGERERSRR